ncbi:hypothetical protein [Mycobacterium simiae]|uniref:hypothetical protein n=1 Tax=Mycobacterium simiae TaxID=1784 RepID=UPI002603037B|nr:hypothetical protein [Mycobacterium simiae]
MSPQLGADDGLGTPLPGPLDVEGPATSESEVAPDGAGMAGTAGVAGTKAEVRLDSGVVEVVDTPGPATAKSEVAPDGAGMAFTAGVAGTKAEVRLDSDVLGVVDTGVDWEPPPVEEALVLPEPMVVSTLPIPFPDVWPCWSCWSKFLALAVNDCAS